MSVTCKEVAEKLLLFRDGELPAAETAHLREHLHLCPNCLTFLGNYEDVVRVVKRLKPVAMPPGTLDRIKEALRRGKRDC